MQFQQAVKKCIIVLLLCGLLFQSNPVKSSIMSPLFDLTLELDGIDDYASVPDDDSLDLGTEGDFTIECFFYTPDLAKEDQDIVVMKTGAYKLNLVYGTDLLDGVRFVVNINMEDIPIFANLDITPGWHHIAAVFDDEYLIDSAVDDNELISKPYLMAIFFDGKQLTSSTDLYNYGVPNTTTPLTIGANILTNPLQGWLEEVRLSDVVRYSGDYVIPSAPFIPDEHTRALWHFDEVWDATEFPDASGNGNTLTGINGAHIGNPSSITPPPLGFGKISPADQAAQISLTPTLTWESSIGATEYQVCIDSDEDAVCHSNWIDTGLNTSYTVPTLNTYTHYQWQVRASNSASTTYADTGDLWSFRTEDSAQAGPVYTLTTSADEFDTLCGVKNCTLRDAIYAAEMDGVASSLVLQAGTLYQLKSAIPDAVYGNTSFAVIRDSLTIQGNGAIIERDPALGCELNGVAEASEFRLFSIASSGELTINHATLRNGCSDGNALSTPGAGSGGSIFNQGSLVLKDTSLANNGAYSGGGALFNDSNAVFEITSSTIMENFSLNGGGGVTNNGTATFTNCTLTNNSTTLDGGGLNNLEFGIATLNFVTITENSVSSGSVGTGGGIANLADGKVELLNSIVGNNTDFVSSAPDCAGNITSLGYNLVKDTSNCDYSPQTSDLLDQNPYLLPLTNNGGPTLTHAPWAMSPALDRVPPGVNGCGTSITTDQRGMERPQDVNDDGISSCDIGSVEAFEGSIHIYYVYLTFLSR